MCCKMEWKMLQANLLHIAVNRRPPTCPFTLRTRDSKQTLCSCSASPRTRWPEVFHSIVCHFLHHVTALFFIFVSGNGVKKVTNFQVEMERCFFGSDRTGFSVLHKFFNGLEAFRLLFEIT